MTSGAISGTISGAISTDSTHKVPLIVLAVETEADVYTISSYLTARGYRLVLAQNGEEAIALVKSERPNLVLMDLQMPRMNAIEAIAQIRQLPHLSHVPIIALTASIADSDRDQYLKAGADAYFRKPLKLKQLAHIIQEHLASSTRSSH
jgi:hypothetical protein